MRASRWSWSIVLALAVLVSCDSSPYKKLRFSPTLHVQQDFDTLARLVDQSSLSGLRHVMFILDRRDSNRIYYINSKIYDWHLTFAHAHYLSLDNSDDFFEHNYRSANRRFVVGNVAWQPAIKQYTWELYEGDVPTAEIMKLTHRVVNQTFFAPVVYRPISIYQEAASKDLGIARVTQTDIAHEQNYTALHIATGIGKLRIISKVDSNTDLKRDEIVVIDEMPLDLTPVAGVIAAQPSTVLSHVNLLARAWNIPNIYLRNAKDTLRSLEGKWILLKADRDTFTIREATAEEIAQTKERIANRSRVIPKSTLSERRLRSLSDQYEGMRRSYGAKSANLGEVLHEDIKGVSVPPGFTIPFAYYADFVHVHGFDTAAAKLLKNSRFEQDRLFRRQKLLDLQKSMIRATMDSELTREILDIVHDKFAGKGLFVRSSTNNEDLAEFSGAGLYSTVPNVRGDSAIIEAIKTVWASVWNLQAYEARESAGVDHEKVYMAVLLQQAIPSESSGVMITANPFDREDRNAVYISAKRGLGIKVVDGGKVAEQVLFHSFEKSTRILTHSEDDEMLVFDEHGGVKPVSVAPETSVLTEDLTLRLANAALKIKELFGFRDQDIEWAYSKGTLYIIQSRPYIDPK